jgi:hypothetical protein
MNETLRNKLDRLLADDHIYKVEINIKCKTKDGMIYTLDFYEYDRPDGDGVTTLPFADGVHSDTVGNLLHITNVVEKGDGYWLSTEELVAVKHTEIVRIWAELGDLYYDEMPEAK